MKRQRVYLETTLFNYYFDKERDGHLSTIKLFENIGKGINHGYISDIVDFELQNAHEPKRTNMLKLINKFNITTLNANEAIYNLSNIYIKENIIPEKFIFDSYHIASATVHNLDCLLSFNFKHINKKRTKDLVSLVNLREGYSNIYIYTPEEVLNVK